MSAWIVGAALGLYAAALFGVGWWAQRRPLSGPSDASLITALSIGVYCTSWTFYGAVGTAVRSGWDYLPIYLGPILAFTLGRGIIGKTVALGKGHGATSLSDLLSRRFGRSGRVAALVTLTAVLFSIPYITLQLIAVSSTFAAVTGNDAARSPFLVLGLAAVLAAFGLLFGIRNRDVTRANPGLVGAIAFDSLFKLAAFMAVALVAMLAIKGEPLRMPSPADAPPLQADRFVVLTVLSACAVLCLPRQFHMTVVEARSERQVRRAGPVIVLYLLLFAALVLPLAAAGQKLAAATPPDLFVLAVPDALGLGALQVVAFTGGFAAAAGMVIVTGVALGNMVASDLVVPMLIRTDGGRAFSRIVTIRRLTLIALTGISAIFALVVPADAMLAELGVVAFAGAAQFAPLLLAALYVPKATESGAVAGLAAGSLSWAVFVLAPAFFAGSPVDWSSVPEAVLPFLSDPFTRGAVLALGANLAALAAVSLAKPLGLRGREDAARFAALAPGVVGPGAVRVADLRDLLLGIIGPEETEALFSVFHPLTERGMAPAGLVSAAETKLSRVLGNASANILVTRLLAEGRIEAGDVMILVGDASRELRFGQELLATTLENLAEGVSVIDGDGRLVAWNRAYEDLFGYPPGFLKVGLPVEALLRHNRPDLPDAAIERRVARLAEGRAHNFETRLRDGRVVRLQGRPAPGGGYVTSFSEVTEYREAQAALRESERATRFYTDNIPFPIGFSDADEVIRFHNKAFAAMVGRPGGNLAGERLDAIFGAQYAFREPAIRSVLSGTGCRFVLSPGEIGGEITWQVTYVPQLEADGSVAGFFGFYQDISQRRAAQAALEEANRSLETRVIQRTSELQHANQELERAREEAEAANRSKTRFLAAASHDVLQPLNAARLFASSLEDEVDAGSDAAETARRIGAAIGSADTLLRALLNLSRLEAGGVDPRFETVALGPYLEGILAEFQPLAAGKGLALRGVPSRQMVRTDPGLLRSALQNLVSNALRYTDDGGVLVGVRRRGGNLAIEVVDTGRGIDAEDIPGVFDEFSRLGRDRDIEGAGLGLATVRRVAELLGHEIEVSSVPGRGTTFRILMPRVGDAAPEPHCERVAPASLSGFRVLCVDNDRAVLDALKMRFVRWGAETEACAGICAVREVYDGGAPLPDLLVLDYQLDDGATGLDVLDFFRDGKGLDCPAILVTASRDAETGEAIRQKGVSMLPKPVEPAALRALSVSLLSGRKA